ncbi:HAD family hydrolase, partial [Micromonospora sp. NPDC000207]|uniref:HAD family hydrolase n=1 Tax=Micromonospora sp. NPDC000207 TaxID=3154246 RepID=UPI00332DEB49
MSADLGRLLGEVGAVLLDFDGPVCSIFAGYPAPLVAGELVDVLRREEVAVTSDLADEPDPLEVLRRTGASGDQGATRAVEAALCAAERRAVETAEPTPYGREVIVAARQAGMPVAAVSNNSAGAVSSYLVAHRLAGHVTPVIGRAYAEPTRMKPHPEPILQAVHALGQSPSRCVLVGDSLTDIEG